MQLYDRCITTVVKLISGCKACVCVFVREEELSWQMASRCSTNSS